MTISRSRILAMLAALVLVATGSAFLASPAAQAATGTCAGSKVGGFDLYGDVPINGSTRYGYVEVYYSGGYNCARTVSSSNTWGVSKVMSVELWVCSSGTSSCRLLSADDRDHGTYRYYAGPVTAWAAGKCIWVIGNIYYPPTDSNAGNNKAGWCG
ncbi:MULTISPECIES: hypothetical protein [unclassified Micromonospora]|uniref:hypothetical protein n=1 Tax=unclassified Micromonospora TaxID=2617518 RepID=UPI003316698A